MRFNKDDKSRRVLILSRGMKTLFFLISMFASLLIFSAPILLIITDTLLPSALLSVSFSHHYHHPSPLSLKKTLSSHLNSYDFRYSIVDIPLISIVRSTVIFCVYCMCDGPKLSRWPYFGITTLCSLLSLVFVSMKASYIYGTGVWGATGGNFRGLDVAVFMCSLVLAVGHIIVAYRTSWRERRKLLIYNIDIEAVTTYKKHLLIPMYQKKFLLEEEQQEEDKVMWTPRGRSQMRIT